MNSSWTPEPIGPFSSDQVDDLVEAPLVMVLIFFAPDGDVLAVNPLHILQVLNEHKNIEEPLLTSITKILIENMESIGAKMFVNDFRYAEKVEKFRDIVDSTLSEQDATSFKTSLATIAKKASELVSGDEPTTEISQKLVHLMGHLGLLDAFLKNTPVANAR